MQNFKDILVKLVLTCILFMMLCAAFGHSLVSEKLYNYEDTIVLYDTIFVYDTIWEYDYIYDTIWVYDTTINNHFEISNLSYMEPIKVQFIHLSHYHYRGKNLTFSSHQFKKRERKKVNSNWYYNFRIKQRFKKNEPKQKKQSVTAEGRLTLNPTAGSFNPTIFSRGVFSTELYSGYVFDMASYHPKADMQIHKDVENATQNLNAFEYGIRANYNLFQYGAHIGIGVLQLNEAFNYIETQTLVDSTQRYHVFPDTTYTVDTTKFVDMIYYLQTGEIRYYNIYDTTYHYGFDSTGYYTYDTSYNHFDRKTINNYRLLEIPLILSYEFGYAKSSYQLKLGGVNQFHMYSSGETFFSEGYIQSIKRKDHVLYNFALYAGFGFIYDINASIAFTLDAYYKHPLRDFSKHLPYTIRRKYYGANFSIRYKF